MPAAVPTAFRAFFPGEAPVLDGNAPFRGGPEPLIMTDDDGGLVSPAGRFTQEHGHVPAGPRVQVAGGLIGKNQPGIIGQGPGAGDALLLPAGEHPGQAPQPVSELALFQRRPRFGPDMFTGFSCRGQRHHDVFLRI